VGVWQIREGIREAMKQRPFIADSLDEGIDYACKPLSISKSEWLAKGDLLKLIKQKSITEFF